VLRSLRVLSLAPPLVRPMLVLVCASVRCEAVPSQRVAERCGPVPVQSVRALRVAAAAAFLDRHAQVPRQPACIQPFVPVSLAPPLSLRPMLVLVFASVQCETVPSHRGPVRFQSVRVLLVAAAAFLDRYAPVPRQPACTLAFAARLDDLGDWLPAPSRRIPQPPWVAPCCGKAP
jgi:hypothetical protein